MLSAGKSWRLTQVLSKRSSKSYIAYKAETNFVDAIPQAGGLKLILNMPFHELYDLHGLARDITNIGSLGNGDIEVQLNDSKQLFRIMGLVRQAFEKQMGDGGSRCIS